MSHDHSRRGSCSLRLIIRLLHSIIHSLAGDVTAVVVGSGALLGRFFTGGEHTSESAFPEPALPYSIMQQPLRIIVSAKTGRIAVPANFPVSLREHVVR